MFIENFTKFIKYYGSGRKTKLFGFFMLSVIAGSFEFLGIALIYPFILLIIGPQSIIHTKYYLNFANFFHVSNVLVNAFILGLIVTLLFVAKNLFMILSLYLQNKFINNWKLAISKKFMHYYLFSPYKNTMETSASEKIYNLTFLITQTLDGFVFRVINLVTNVVIVAMILSLLVIKFPFAALVTGIFVVFSMLFQSRLLKKKIEKISQKLFKLSVSNNEKMMENINNLKEIKILSAENHFYNEYLTAQRDFNKIVFENNFYGGISPYIIEILVVLSLFLLAGFISLQKIGNTYWMVASYAIIVAAIFRIAPALNRIQSSVNAVNTSRDFVKTMVTEYEKKDFDFTEEKSDFKIKFKNGIKLKDICFSYGKAPVIKALNLEINKGEFLGIIGLSGAGKSTLADIIMGLLPIDSGEIFVDKTKLNQSNFNSLRKLIGYVPQQVNILDGSFKRNVAWGVEEKEIDEKKIIEVLKKARIYDFVSGFEHGINSNVIVGSNGLSQGQKQRLAIARALYREPEILIFDEATSSLDVETEHEITQMLNKLKGEKTVIAIAHRLSTLKSCDRLIYLKEGKIVDAGSFKELSKKHADFENLVKLSNLSEM
ncbi:MAG: ABC transporter ATP-binding protein [Candidatus Gastranaerophilaceae bacterium]